MALINAEHINPFLMAATKVLKDICMSEVTIGKPFMKEAVFTDDTVVIMIGIVGEIQGNMMLEMKDPTALAIASKMCMMPITVLDELSMSALSELVNMIMGNAATVFSTNGVIIDITPPKLSRGNEAFTSNFKNLSIPLTFEGNTLYLNMMIQEG